MTAAADTALQAAVSRADDARLESPRGFDAIVVGAGASGGLAALELTAAGLEVLVLDAGWRPGLLRAPVRTATAKLVRTLADPRFQTMLPPRLVGYGVKALKLAGRWHQPVQTRCFAWPMAPEAFVSDRERPYAQDDGEFHWFRAEQLGGKMIVPGHGRQYYRMGAADLHPADGLSPPWPFGFDELAPWYDHVEDLLGVCGGANAEVPPQRQVKPTAAEEDTMAKVMSAWSGVTPMIGRSAPPLDSLGLAATHGTLFLRRGAIGAEVLVDGDGVTRGVSFFDRTTGGLRSVKAPLVFLCASALESTRILLASRPPAGPIGARSGALGRYLMDHVILSGEGSGGALPEEPVPNLPGRCVYIPRLDRRAGEPQSATRGYGAQIYRWSTLPGRSYFNCVTFAEMLPNPENRVVLDREAPDAFGLPTLRISCRHSPAELATAEEQARTIRELGAMFDIRFDRLPSGPAAPGTAIHECGTARMGDDPATSVLDPFNQCWDAKGLYVTDGASFDSQGIQNPTLTIMALTARACAHATASVPGRNAPRTGASLRA